MMTKSVLPADPVAAIQMLMDITLEMKQVMEDEARAIALRNEVGMLDAETQKAKILPRYQQAAQEFRARMEEFRKISPSLLDQLQDTQDSLGAVTKDNQFYLAS